MKSVHDQLRESIYSKCGLSDRREVMPPLSELKKTEWSPRFEQGCRNRMILGAFRYGRLNDPNKPSYNRVDSIRQRLDLYISDGNAEHLMDISNMCMLEFEEPNHPNFHFKAQDDTIHTEKL